MEWRYRNLIIIIINTNVSQAEILNVYPLLTQLLLECWFVCEWI